MWKWINESIAIGRSSWRVLLRNPQWIVFPLLSGTASLLVLAAFAAPLAHHRPEIFQRQYIPHGAERSQDLFFAFAYYLSNYAVMYFFNSALLACAVLRFKGGRPTLADGLACACKRLPHILTRALVSATVGMVLRTISDRSNWFGKIVIAVVGFSWTLATFFVVPIMVEENIGPLKATKRSMRLIRETWGDVFFSEFVGLGFFTLALMAPGIVLALPGAFLLPGPHAVGLVLVGAGLLEILAVVVVGSALNVIYLGALYRYASHGKAPRAFGKEMLQDWFVA